ncbi:DUF6090 family protein [uncultured Psychroserpens sp.]|uniref:DUF6090 family protein n=1 Tax=uncultured Psychroserpens sp. TaxID=255436 RepID=UPI00261B200F|nr:DUF6090 family protein [uncultured Psychroserpens sp.]
MGRFKKIITKTNAKYLLSEVVLIFVGISLAIWFNNWNENRKTNSTKSIVLSKLQSEINNNYEEIENSIQHLDTLIKTLSDFKKISNFNTAFEASLEQLNQFQKNHPSFYKIHESKKITGSHLYNFDGSITMYFEITNLRFIALETAKTTNTLGKIKYDCLYNLEDLYSQKYRVSRLTNRAVELMQEGDFEGLLRNLKQIRQLNTQLIQQYEKTKYTFNDC